MAGGFSNATVKIEGSIGEVRALQGIDLNVGVTGKNLEELERVINTKLPTTDAFDISGHLLGSGTSPTLENMRGNISAGDSKLTVSGRIGNLIALQDLNLQLKSSGKNLAQAGAMVGQKLPSSDEFELQGRLTGSAGALLLEEIQGHARRGRLRLDVTGAIKDLLALKGMDLGLKAFGGQLAEIGPLIGKTLPGLGPFDLSGHMIGSWKSAMLEDISGYVSAAGSEFSVSGRIGNLITLQDLNLQLKISGKDLAQAETIIGRKLPSTDEFVLQGRLTGSVGNISLHEIRGLARHGGLRLTAEGVIGDLVAFRRVDLLLRGDGKNLAQAAAIVGQKLPSTDEFALQGRLTGSAGALSLLDGRGHARRGSLSLDATGAIKDLLALKGMDLRLKAFGNELAEIGPLIGKGLPEMGPFDLSGNLSGSAKFFYVGDLTAVVDQSDFNGVAKIEFRKRPKITLVLESSLLDMTTLLKNLEKNEKLTGRKPGMLERRLFRNDPLPFDILKKVDADISLDAKKVRARDADFEFGRLRVELEDGELNVDTLQATYKQTRISGNLHLYSESPPRVVGKFLVQDFDLGALLRELRVSDQVRSHLDIAVDVNSRGDSVHSLMTDLYGSVGAVMGEGFLTRYLDLLSVDLSKKVIPFWGSHHKAGEIRCAVVQFDINKGIATSRAFVFDTEIGVLTGEGEINLATEQVNFLLAPEPRYPSLMSLATKLRVSGTIMDPKVRPDMLSLLTKGARALSALVVGPLGLLAPFVSLGAHKTHPCNVQSIGK
jgi:hypothetical protein